MKDRVAVTGPRNSGSDVIYENSKLCPDLQENGRMKRLSVYMTLCRICARACMTSYLSRDLFRPALALAWYMIASHAGRRSIGLEFSVMLNLFRVVLALAAYLGSSRGLYFHIAETEQKCFIEEVPAETMIVGEFLINAHVPLLL